MNFILGKNVKPGQKILIGTSWKKIKEVLEDSIVLSDNTTVLFGSEINGWKAS